MKRLTLLLQLTLLVSVISVITGQTEYKLVCYYSNWSQYRRSPFQYFPENIDPCLCTHINFAFARVQGSNIVPYEWNDESTSWMTGNYAKVMALKQRNPNLKILLALGGWNHGSKPFTDMLATDEGLANFVQNLMEFMRSRNFDGVDIDWEYPGSRPGSNPLTDKQRYTDMIRDLRSAFEREAIMTGQERLLLAAAFAAGKHNIEPAYDIPALGRYFDFVNLMSYDYHGQWDDFTGVNAPLYARRDESEEQAIWNQNWTVNYYLDHGFPREKIVMGLATFGRSFTLQDPLQHDMGDLARGGGTKGMYTRETGFLAYYEICVNLSPLLPLHLRWTREWQNEQLSPYAYWSNQWVGYDDQESLRIRTDYIKAYGLAGAMVWELASDDFSDSCNQGRYPLINAIKSGLGVYQCGQSPINTTTITTTTTLEPTTTTTPTPTTTTTPNPTTTTTPTPTTTTTPTPITTTTTTARTTTTTTPTSTTTTAPPTTKFTPIWRRTTTATPSTTKFIPPWWRSTTVSVTKRDTATTTKKVTTKSPANQGKRRLNAPAQNFREICDPGNIIVEYNPDCSSYVACVYRELHYVMPCPRGLYFNKEALYCDWPWNVPECHY